MRTLLILLLLIGNTAHAEVYKRTNPDGSVEFTDVPSKQEEKPVPVNPMNTFKAPPAPALRSTPKPKASEDKKYTAISITSPANEASIRNNAGNITVNVSLEPALQPGHKLVLLVDGTSKPASDDATKDDGSTPGNFELSNIDRGSHSLVAQVLNEEGETMISSTPVTVYLHRYSAIKH